MGKWMDGDAELGTPSWGRRVGDAESYTGAAERGPAIRYLQETTNFHHKYLHVQTFELLQR